jgi:hypothetical protein
VGCCFKKSVRCVNVNFVFKMPGMSKSSVTCNVDIRLVGDRNKMCKHFNIFDEKR